MNINNIHVISIFNLGGTSYFREYGLSKSDVSIIFALYSIDKQGNCELNANNLCVLLGGLDKRVYYDIIKGLGKTPYVNCSEGLYSITEAGVELVDRYLNYIRQNVFIFNNRVKQLKEKRSKVKKKSKP